MKLPTKYPTWGEPTWKSSWMDFDRLFDEMHKAIKTDAVNQSFPKYNILKRDNEHMAIELAIAGWSEDNVTIQVEDRYVIVSGKKDDKDDVEYIQKGISTKDFSIKFALSDLVVVKDAEFENGLLTINLSVVVPEKDNRRTIPINTTKKKQTYLTE